MRRFADWPARLARFLAERQAMPFKWGRNDCALFVCDAVQVMTGTDMAEMVRGEYSSEQGARAVLGRFAKGGLLNEYAEKIARRYALKGTDWRNLRRGDVGLIETETGGSLGLVLMDGRTIGIPGEMSLDIFPVRIARQGWRIG